MGVSEFLIHRNKFMNVRSVPAQIHFNTFRTPVSIQDIVSELLSGICVGILLFRVCVTSSSYSMNNW
jgi:hypothetical protein